MKFKFFEINGLNQIIVHGSTWDLEIDHIVPFAYGETSAENNLRLLCRAHNNYYAEQSYGKESFQGKRSAHFRTGSKLVR